MSYTYLHRRMGKRDCFDFILVLLSHEFLVGVLMGMGFGYPPLFLRLLFFMLHPLRIWASYYLMVWVSSPCVRPLDTTRYANDTRRAYTYIFTLEIGRAHV